MLFGISVSLYSNQTICKHTNLVSKCSIVGMVISAIGAARSQMKTTLEPVNVKTTLNGTIYKGRLQSLDWTGLDWTEKSNERFEFFPQRCFSTLKILVARCSG